MTASSALAYQEALLPTVAKVALTDTIQTAQAIQSRALDTAYHLQCSAYDQPRLEGRSLLTGSGLIGSSNTRKDSQSHSRKSCSKTDENCKTALCEERDELDVRHKLGHFYVFPRHFANGDCSSNKDGVSKQWFVHLSGSVQAQVLDLYSC